MDIPMLPFVYFLRMAKMTKMAIITVMEHYELASNMVFMGVFLMTCQNADQT